VRIGVSAIARLMTKNGNTGTRRSMNRYNAPSRSTPALIERRLSPKRRWTVSRNRPRATRKASVAPMVEANETMTVPQSNPNSAPPTSVITAAPGSDRAVTAI